jgi:GT2 family glycosyltransferase
VQSLLNACDAVDGTCLLDIFIADNDSCAEQQRLLQQSLAAHSNVHLHINSENQGFSAGHNRNLQQIFLQSKPDFIWILNNDCQVYANSLFALIQCANQQPQVGIWGATLLESDGETIQCAGGCFYNAWISSYRQYGRGKKLVSLDQLKPVGFDYIAGASLFFPVATLQYGLHRAKSETGVENTQKQQWLNEIYFLYFEELDLARRLKPGLEMAWCKNALVKHAGGDSTGTAENQRSKLAEYHSTLSALKYTRLYHPRRLWLMVPLRYLSKCLQLIFKGEFRLLGSLTRAYRDFLFV